MSMTATIAIRRKNGTVDLTSSRWSECFDGALSRVLSPLRGDYKVEQVVSLFELITKYDSIVSVNWIDEDEFVSSLLANRKYWTIIPINDTVFIEITDNKPNPNIGLNLTDDEVARYNLDYGAVGAIYNEDTRLIKLFKWDEDNWSSNEIITRIIDPSKESEVESF